MEEDGRPKIIKEGQYEKRGFFGSNKLGPQAPTPLPTKSTANDTTKDKKADQNGR